MFLLISGPVLAAVVKAVLKLQVIVCSCLLKLKFSVRLLILFSVKVLNMRIIPTETAHLSTGVAIRASGGSVLLVPATAAISVVSASSAASPSTPPPTTAGPTRILACPSASVYNPICVANRLLKSLPDKGRDNKGMG